MLALDGCEYMIVYILGSKKDPIFGHFWCKISRKKWCIAFWWMFFLGDAENFWGEKKNGPNLPGGEFSRDLGSF